MKQLILAIVISFIITIIIGPIIIPILQKLKFGQSIREEGPKSHIKKSGTPTMGGIIIISAVFIASIIFALGNSDLMIAMLVTLGFGIIGLVDDFIKVVLKRNLGLKPYQKLIGQFIIAIIIAIYAANHPYIGTSLLIPFTNEYIDLGMLYIPLTIFAVVGTANSVNLTDGLDGLASGVTLIVSSFFALVSLGLGYYGLSIFAGTIVGACLGFLKFNYYPARVFMGDTGSMALGGAVASLAVLTRMQLFLPIIGGVYVIEAVSVILQVLSFKLTGKRIFKMSPLHHHFELKGWHETKVVIVFWMIALILAIISMLALSIY
ncbi:phospho-N-acetylmuramoyl-pentapeptide-transferase [Garciella nitratireducens]|uniref:Phospho-N-acetylmuramoyl-pentapeptide-transferase n=1 Tax=Garciella nitratireducens DSM 15102 TaxID=1121911 RepID=A0A1T4JTB4_9FIRM|nr:phospho-N-acetylmuramoyl-pentapeptide-transferase [Garciella nitratireducens]RBP45553.1 phospho-N-acetylmuramoyl-pentapeptide-transferase [Garciella nitratireducens]SJZ33381.1 Phospho-N-acetylmuramoyl-pentapeptide-transferase [Garciella nitratireducens DSM 15102]